MNRIETRTAIIIYNEASISYSGDDIVRIVLRDNFLIDYEDVLDNQLVIKALTKGVKTRNLIERPKNVRIEKKARKYLKEADHRSVIAKAVLIDSIIKTCINNFVLKLRKPKVPTRFFTDEMEARKWLLKFHLRES